MPNPTEFSPAIVVATCLLLGWIGISQVILFISYLKLDPFWPEDAPRPVSWNSRGALALILLWIAMQYIAVFAVSASMRPPGKADPFSPAELMISSGLANLGLICLAPRFLATGSGRAVRASDLLGPEPGWNFLRGVSNWGFLVPWIYGLYFAALRVWTPTKHPMEVMMRADQTPTTLIISALSAVVLAPIAEEVLFRGALLGWLTKLTMPASKSSATADFSNDAIVGESLNDQEAPPPPSKPLVSFWLVNVLVSVIFSLMHWQAWPSPVPIFLLSLGLGVLYQKTGGLAASIGLHMTFNGISTTMLFLSLASKAVKAP